MKKVNSDELRGELLEGQSKELLQELHLLTRNGDLNADARRKLKQINHFAGFLKPAIEDLVARHADPMILDLGAGNAYLGFILYEIFWKDLGRGRIHSLDARPEFVARGEARAKKLGYARMHFTCSEITTFKPTQRVHLLTALHACDTATDDAIALGIAQQVDYLFLVPCCQAELANLLTRQDTPVGLLYGDPHHRRIFASHLTNVIRVLALRSHGYQVTVTELTTWEHTAKGELLIAKRVQAFDAKARTQLQNLLELFQITPRLLQNLRPSA